VLLAGATNYYKKSRKGEEMTEGGKGVDHVGHTTFEMFCRTRQLETRQTQRLSFLLDGKQLMGFFSCWAFPKQSLPLDARPGSPQGYWER
jgi:hypothetical protein